MLGGQAGGQDYSLASMLGSQTPHDTATTLQTGKLMFLLCDCKSSKQACTLLMLCVGPGSKSQGEPQRDLGNPLLSAGAQDLLQGAGVMSGAQL